VGLANRLAELRGPVQPRPLDARALAALAANPGCRRRSLLDAAGVDKGAVAAALGAPAPFGQSQFAFARGHSFEARVTADGCAELLRLLGAAEGERAELPDLRGAGPAERLARTRQALADAAGDGGTGGWTLLVHPLLSLDVAGSAAHLEPDVIAVRPDGLAVVVEVKSFPMLDGSADAAKAGAAARQAAVYVLALERLGGRPPGHRVLLVCPRDFSNQPTAAWLDVRKQLAVTRRQLDRMTRVADIAAALPPGTTFDLRLGPDGRTPTRPAADLGDHLDTVPAAYSPDCRTVCELADHCRSHARAAGSVELLGRGVRAELGDLRTIADVLRAARGEAYGAPGTCGETDAYGDPAAYGKAAAPADPADPAVAALRRAHALRAEALAQAAPGGAR
jgi:hypothetical protein